MTIAMMVDNPEGSQEGYDAVRAKLGLEKPAGGILHLAGASPNVGWRLIDVFESEEDAKRFRRSLGDLSDCIDTVEARQVQVHQNDVWL
jgi:hypothetical protein